MGDEGLSSTRQVKKKKVVGWCGMSLSHLPFHITLLKCLVPLSLAIRYFGSDVCNHTRCLFYALSVYDIHAYIIYV